MMNRSTVFLSLLIGTLLFSGCKKDDNRVDGIPDVFVDLQININNPAYDDLIIPTGWVYQSGGSKGLILYRRSTTEIVAMDRHCPYQPEDGCAIAVNESGIIAEDDCCGSQFSIHDGSIIQGPAAHSLHMYNTTFDGTMLRVFN